MEIISTEFRFPQEVFRISNPENRKPQAFKILPNKMPQSNPVVLTLQTEKCLLLLERGVAFLLLLQAPQEAYQQPRKWNAIFVGL